MDALLWHVVALSTMRYLEGNTTAGICFKDWKMARTKKVSPLKRANTEIRNLLLRYFYDRNSNATSSRGKKRSATSKRNLRPRRD
jgi:hypothetical protein